MFRFITQTKVRAPRKATRRRLLIPISLAAALGALSVGALSASAEPAPVPDSTYACTFQGLTGALDNKDPAVPAGGGVQSIGTDIGNDDAPPAATPGTPLGLFMDGDRGPIDDGALIDFLQSNPPGTGPSLLDEDSGEYTFSGGGLPTNAGALDGDTAICVHVDGDSGPLSTNNGTGVAAVDINTAGVYVNSICGTGMAHNTDPPTPAPGDPAVVDLTENNTGGDPDLDDLGDFNLLNDDDSFSMTLTGLDATNPFEVPINDLHYEIAFVGGQGALVIKNATNTDGSGLVADPGGDGEQGHGAGYVNIVPDVQGGSSCVAPGTGVTNFLVTGAFVVTMTENGETAADGDGDGIPDGNGANEEN